MKIALFLQKIAKLFDILYGNHAMLPHLTLLLLTFTFIIFDFVSGEYSSSFTVLLYLDKTLLICFWELMNKPPPSHWDSRDIVYTFKSSSGWYLSPVEAQTPKSAKRSLSPTRYVQWASVDIYFGTICQSKLCYHIVIFVDY